MHHDAASSLTGTVEKVIEPMRTSIAKKATRATPHTGTGGGQARVRGAAGCGVVKHRESIGCMIFRIEERPAGEFG